MEKIRRHILFYGWVQGVGFRYRAYYAAMDNGVGGWVRNLPDGSVEAELEGEESAIDRMIMQIENSRYVHIESMKVTKMPLLDEDTFRIRD